MREISISPRHSADDALQSALTQLNAELPADQPDVTAALEIFDFSVLEKLPADPRLTWRLTVPGLDREVFIDAHTSEIVFNRSFPIRPTSWMASISTSAILAVHSMARTANATPSPASLRLRRPQPSMLLTTMISKQLRAISSLLIPIGFSTAISAGALTITPPVASTSSSTPACPTRLPVAVATKFVSAMVGWTLKS